MSEFIVNGKLDMATIRRQLNELQFENGIRKLHIGDVTDLFVEPSPDDVARTITRFREQLSEKDLSLTLTSEDPGQLFVEQQLKHRPGDPNAMARAMQWVSRITTVALEMVIPAVIGTWLDGQLETSFLGLLGLLIGVPLGLWHLIKMTKG